MYSNSKITCQIEQKQCNLYIVHFCLAWTEFRKRLWSLILYVHSRPTMYVVRSMYVVIFKIDHCIHIHSCNPMGLGHNDPWVESHMWPQQIWGQRSSQGQLPLVQVFAKRVKCCIHIRWCIFMGLIHNDPWVESHMWPQQPWGQRSSRGQWPFSHLNRYMYGIKSNITMIAQVCDRESRQTRGLRTALLIFCT